jgi:rRNA maturation RNase YbeY
MSSINIHYQTPFKHTLKLVDIKRLVKIIFKKEAKAFNCINIIFCSDSFLLKINQDFLNHNSYTDIITFNYSEVEIEGELYISFERLVENANALNIDIDKEILRLIIHGCLHLCGYKDKIKKDKKEMTEMENLFLNSKR